MITDSYNNNYKYLLLIIVKPVIIPHSNLQWQWRNMIRPAANRSIKKPIKLQSDQPLGD